MERERRKSQRISARNSLNLQEVQPLRNSVRDSAIFQELQAGKRISMAPGAKFKPVEPAINHKKHSCTDVPCLLIFICFVVAWCYIAAYAFGNGDLNKVLIPTDSQNRKCGVDSGVRNKTQLFFFDLDKCLDPMITVRGCETKQVCIDECPKETFVWDSHLLYEDPADIRQSLICDENVDKSLLKTHNDMALAIKNGQCSGWYLQSKSFFNRCIPFANVDFCQLVPDVLSNRKRRQVATNNEQLPPSSAPLISLDDITESFARFKNRTTSLCKGNATAALLLKQTQQKAQESNTGLTKIVAAFISKFNSDVNEKMAEGINEDLKSSWKVILLAFIVHVVVVLIFITLLRWVATPLVWLSILGVICGLAFLLLHGIKQYLFWRDAPHVPQHDAHLMATFQNVIQNPDFWLYLSIVTGAALFIILLIVVFIRKRISIAIAIVKEASKAIMTIKSSIFFPIFPGLLYILVTVLATFIILYLSSIGDFSFKVFKHLKNGTTEATEQCICSGPAATYNKLLNKCNPEIFENHCRIGDSDRPCLETVCRFVEIEHTFQTQMFIYYSVFGFFWVQFFISAYGDMVLACTFAMWYWTFDKKKLNSTPLLKAIGITTLYHLGTIAFGSLILSICRMIRYLLEVIEKKVKMYNNSLTRAILWCMKCLFWLLENFLRFLNRNAYITCAIHSTSFCASSKKAFTLITQNLVRMFALDKVSDFLFFLSKLLLTGCTSFATYMFLVLYPNVIRVNYPLVPVVLVAFLAYIMANVIFSTYAMAVDTLFFCFLEDSNENDGSEEKPYYMSKELRKLLSRKQSTQQPKQIRGDFILK